MTETGFSNAKWTTRGFSPSLNLLHDLPKAVNDTGERFLRLEFLVHFLATPATDGSRKKNGRVRGNLVGIPMGKVVAIDSPLERG